MLTFSRPRRLLLAILAIVCVIFLIQRDGAVSQSTLGHREALNSTLGVCIARLPHPDPLGAECGPILTGIVPENLRSQPPRAHRP